MSNKKVSSRNKRLGKQIITFSGIFGQPLTGQIKDWVNREIMTATEEQQRRQKSGEDTSEMCKKDLKQI